MTTLMQVASRILLVWGIGYNFPQVVATSPAYSSMLFAWSVTEVVRYSYFVFFLGGGVPSWLLWLRWVYISTCLARKRRARRILRDRAIGDLNTAIPEKAQTIEIALLAWEYPAYIYISCLLFSCRYNTFYVLYPLGVASETWLIYKAIEPASRWNPLFGYALWAILAIYVPGRHRALTSGMVLI